MRSGIDGGRKGGSADVDTTGSSRTDKSKIVIGPQKLWKFIICLVWWEAENFG